MNQLLDQFEIFGDDARECQLSKCVLDKQLAPKGLPCVNERRTTSARKLKHLVLDLRRGDLASLVWPTIPPHEFTTKIRVGESESANLFGYLER